SPAAEARTEYLSDFFKEAVALIGRPEAAPSVALAGEPLDPTAYTLVLEIDPQTAWAYGLRGVACAGLKQWDQAAADLRHATEMRPTNSGWWYMQAGALLGAGDASAYRRTRAGMLKQFGTTKASGDATNVCYISIVLPAAPDE